MREGTYAQARKTILRELIESDKVLLIPHWDVDGIASASILKEYLEDRGVEVETYIPEIGVYGWEGLVGVRRIDVDRTVVLDYALKLRDIGFLEDKVGRVLIIDHHVNTLPKTPNILNPYVHTLETYPSTTLVLKELLEACWNLRIVLGLVGDLGGKIWKSRVGGEFRRIIGEKGWRFEDLSRLVEIVDSTYKVKDRKLVARSIDKLTGYDDRLEDALKDDEWLEAYNKVEGEIEKVLSQISGEIVDENILVYEVESEYYIVSSIGRRLALENPDKIVVLLFRHLPHHNQVYVRSWKYDLEGVLKKLEDLGYNVGGKNEVFSIQLGRRGFEEVLPLVIGELKRASRPLT